MAASNRITTIDMSPVFNAVGFEYSTLTSSLPELAITRAAALQSITPSGSSYDGLDRKVHLGITSADYRPFITNIVAGLAAVPAEIRLGLFAEGRHASLRDMANLSVLTSRAHRALSIVDKSIRSWEEKPAYITDALTANWPEVSVLKYPQFYLALAAQAPYRVNVMREFIALEAVFFNSYFYSMRKEDIPSTLEMLQRERERNRIQAEPRPNGARSQRLHFMSATSYDGVMTSLDAVIRRKLHELNRGAHWMTSRRKASGPPERPKAVFLDELSRFLDAINDKLQGQPLSFAFAGQKYEILNRVFRTGIHLATDDQIVAFASQARLHKSLRDAVTEECETGPRDHATKERVRRALGRRPHQAVKPP